MNRRDAHGPAHHIAAAAVAAWLAAGCAASTPPAQAPVTAQRPATPLDRSVAPAPGPAPVLDLPPIQRFTLSNGLEVLLVEQHELPVVDIDVLVRTGAGADTGRVAGRATLAADLLDEGTETRSALEIAEAIDFLGAGLETRASWDATSASLHVLRPRLEPALEILADVVIHPAFPEQEVRRKKEERLTALLQQQDEPRILANNAFAEVLYGTEHPYGRPILGTPESIRALDRDALVDFYGTYFRPGNAAIVVVGDVTRDEIHSLLERHFGAWQPAPVPATEPPAPPAPGPTAITIVHKPGAAQSEIRVGQIGVARDTPDYFPLLVMNTVLGGSFSSRLNIRLREERAYTYGAGSSFDERRAPGPFVASTAVFTGVTDSAVVDLLREIRRIREEPVPADELARAKNYIALGLPRSFETTGDIADHIGEVVVYGLGDEYYDDYIERVQAVSAADVQRVAQRHLDPERMAIVIAGDRAEIEAKLEALGIGPVQVRELK